VLNCEGIINFTIFTWLNNVYHLRSFFLQTFNFMGQLTNSFLMMWWWSICCRWFIDLQSFLLLVFFYKFMDWGWGYSHLKRNKITGLYKEVLFFLINVRKNSFCVSLPLWKPNLINYRCVIANHLKICIWMIPHMIMWFFSF
jgi:hypothetical protein